MENLSLKLQYDIVKDNKLIYKSDIEECHSFVKAWLIYLTYAIGGAYSFNLKDTGNVTRSGTGDVDNRMKVAISAGDVSQGIVAGIGTNAVTLDDYALQTIIGHGAGAGQLQYSDCSVGAPGYTASTITETITRVFTNASGGTITIKEIGIYGFSNRAYCIARDLVDIELFNGAQLTLNYILEVSI
jgi:hypothetical protein